jgi:preprotein translocase subunit SecD
MANRKRQHYYPGTGSTFTPSRYAQWTEKFNQLFDQESGKDPRVSKNSFTEELLVRGLEMVLNEGKSSSNNAMSIATTEPNISSQDKDGLYVSLDGLSEQQQKYLCSQEGKQMVTNMIRYMSLSVMAVESSKTSAYQVDETDSNVDGVPAHSTKLEVTSTNDTPARANEEKSHKKENSVLAKMKEKKRTMQYNAAQ